MEADMIFYILQVSGEAKEQYPHIANKMSIILIRVVN